MKNNENGRSMIEMLGVLAIVGVLSVGGIAGYTKAMTQYRINKTINQITHVSQNIRAFYATQRGDNKYSNLRAYSTCFSGGSLSTSFSGYLCSGAAIVQKAKLVPDDVYGGGDSGLENAFGGDFNIDGGAGYSGVFKIELTGIPEEACVAIATQNWEAVSAGILAVEVVGGNNYDLYCSKSWSISSCYDDRRLPIPLDKATSSCKSSDSNNLVFHFK